MDGITGILIFQYSLLCVAYRVFTIAILFNFGIFFQRWFLLKSAPNEARSVPGARPILSIASKSNSFLPEQASAPDSIRWRITSTLSFAVLRYDNPLSSPMLGSAP